jgi:drug/metabolite transporter (DMT)-like permease
VPEEGTRRTESTEGILFGVAAYGFWGIVAIYFKLLTRVSPLEILAHRIVWSVVVLVAIITILRRWPALARVARNRRTLRLLLLSTVLVAVNWFVFIWAVTHNHLVEASLGYFINPLAVFGLPWPDHEAVSFETEHGAQDRPRVPADFLEISYLFLGPARRFGTTLTDTTKRGIR